MVDLTDIFEIDKGATKIRWKMRNEKGTVSLFAGKKIPDAARSRTGDYGTKTKIYFSS
jgi:hypothetical protein